MYIIKYFFLHGLIVLRVKLSSLIQFRSVDLNCESVQSWYHTFQSTLISIFCPCQKGTDFFSKNLICVNSFSKRVLKNSMCPDIVLSDQCAQASFLKLIQFQDHIFRLALYMPFFLLEFPNEIPVTSLPTVLDNAL